MAPSTDRQTFRETVALVAARAKARLPEAVNGRVESAARLVLLHDVTPQEDGTILVGSSTDPCKQYRLMGDTCECQDWRHGQAPGGWCQHRIAAGIAKRVQELLPPEPAPVVPDILEPWPDNDMEEVPAPAPAPPVAPLPEASASVNVHLTIDGRDCLVTLRDHDEGRLLERLAVVLAQYPAPQPPAPSQGQEGWCARHSVAMKLNQKNGHQWFSHRLATGEYCKGR
jgi:hypothetical protein